MPIEQADNDEVTNNSDKLGKQIDLLSSIITWGIGLLSTLLIIVGFYGFLRLQNMEDKTEKAIDRAEKTFDLFKQIISKEIIAIEELKDKTKEDQLRIEKLVNESSDKVKTIDETKVMLERLHKVYESKLKKSTKEIKNIIERGKRFQMNYVKNMKRHKIVSML